MMFSSLSPAAMAVWAKSNDANGHSLLCHMLDVAAVARELLQREPPSTTQWAAQAWGLNRTDLVQAVPIWIGLHDIGKATPGFQAKWAQGKEALTALGMPFHAHASGRSHHDLSSGGILADMAALGPAPVRQAVAAAVSGHHGYIVRRREFSRPSWLDGPEWNAVRTEILDAYLRALGECPVPAGPVEGVTPAAMAWLAGLTTVCDWIGSNPEFFSHGTHGESASEHLRSAQARAARALDAIGWPTAAERTEPQGDGPMTWTTEQCVARALGSTDAHVAARPLQVVGDALLAAGRGPALVLVEAPMGEGKTELAFMAHLRLAARNQHRGLFVALPTQATSNAMFQRTAAFLTSLDGGAAAPVRLIHGGAAYHLRFARLRAVNNNTRDSTSASDWFAQRKRPLLAPDGVGTVDQALLGAMQVKHHFVRLWGLANRVVVIDEVHAYDEYTGGLVEALLRWLKALRCSVVVMSATLPARKRKALLTAWGHTDVSPNQYPRVLVADDSGVRADSFEARPMATVVLAQLGSDAEDIAARAHELVLGGGCGAIIVNTVARAQAVYQLLVGMAAGSPVEVLLFHAGFPMDERAEREASVLDKFGRHAARPVASLLVATQVVEQSLDVDFDFMISDLAPIDLLLQRAGRLHRHERQRPVPHAVPTLWVAGTLGDDLPDLKQTAWGFVYDPYILIRSWECVRARDVWVMPRAIDALVQEVYGQGADEPERPADWQARVDAELGRHFADVQQQTQRAANVTLDVGVDGLEAFSGPRGSDESDGAQLRMVTRLGPESVRVVPVHVGPDGWRVHETSLPFDPQGAAPDALAEQLYARQVSISRRAVVVGLQQLPQLPLFESHPLLRDLVPMPLVHGTGEYGGVAVRLDPALGLVFIRPNPIPEVS